MRFAMMLAAGFMALALAFLAGRWSAPGPGVAPKGENRTPFSGSEQESLPEPLTGRVPAAASPRTPMVRSSTHEGPAKAPASRRTGPLLGIDFARAHLERFTDPEQRAKTLEAMRFFDDFGSAEHVLASKTLNPLGLRLSEARKRELDRVLAQMRVEEREHAFAMEELMARADVDAFERGDVVTWKNEPIDPKTPEGLRKLREREQEFEKRYGKVGQDFFWRAHGVGPRPGTNARVLYRRRTHPGLFAAGDALRELRTRRERFVRSFLERYGRR